MKKLLLCLNLLLSVLLINAQPGSLDKSFGQNGKVRTLGFGDCYVSALQQDGKILAAGEGIAFGFCIIRYLPDGTIDRSFGNEGTVLLNIPSAFLYNMVVLPDKKILLNGFSYNNQTCTVKLKEDGTIDSSFGVSGISSVPLKYGDGLVYMAVQADGKIVLAGSRYVGAGNNIMLLLRLKANGSRDETFGDRGFITNRNGFSVSAIAIQPDQKIITGGHQSQIGAGLEDQFVITRYNTNGSLDNNFGTSGNVFTDVTDGNDVPYALNILKDGKILAAGDLNYGFSNPYVPYMGVVKYNADGSLDKTFGNNGTAKIIFSDTASSARDLQVQQDGKIILSGYINGYNTEGNNYFDFALGRLKDDGSCDSSFGANGRLTTNFGVNAASNSSLLQPDGKIILAGSESPNDSTLDYALARYNTGQSNKQQVIIKIKHYIQNHYNGIMWEGVPDVKSYTIERSTDNRNFTAISTKQIFSKQAAGNNFYEDPLPLAQINYYRVQTKSVDGAISYSNTIAIKTVTPSSILSIYPNPIKDNVLYIKFNGQANISINNASGKVLLIKHISGNESIDITSFTNGIYYLKNDAASKVEKFEVLR